MSWNVVKHRNEVTVALHSETWLRAASGALPRVTIHRPWGGVLLLLSAWLWNMINIGLQVEWKRNVMAHAQKSYLVFQRNGRVHLYRRGCQFSRLLAAEVCASALVMLDRPCSHTVLECWIPTPFASFPFTSPPVLRRVPSDSFSTLTHSERFDHW